MALHSNKSDDLHSLPDVFHEALPAHRMHNIWMKHPMGLEGNDDLKTGALEGFADWERKADWEKRVALNDSVESEGAKEELLSLPVEQHLL